MKKTKIFAAAILLALAMIAPGCAKDDTVTMAMDMSDEKNAVITMNGADKDDFVMSGTLAISEGEDLVIEADLKDGSAVNIALTASEEEQSIDKVPEFGEPDFEVTLDESEVTVYAIDPGEYMVEVTVLKKASGTVNLRTQAAEIEEEDVEEEQEEEE